MVKDGSAGRTKRRKRGGTVLALSDRNILAAERLLRLVANLQNGTRRRASTVGAGASAELQKEWLELSRETLVSRRIRRSFFPPAIVGEPAWDMLLALYVKLERKSAETVTGIAHQVAYPLTTALRWLEYIEQSGFIERTPGITDKRVVLVSLTPLGRKQMESYFTKIDTL